MFGTSLFRGVVSDSPESKRFGHRLHVASLESARLRRGQYSTELQHRSCLSYVNQAVVAVPHNK